MNAYDAALAERERWIAEVERETGRQVVGSGMAWDNAWDITLEMRDGTTVTLHGAAEAADFIDNWDPTPSDDGTARQNGPEIIGQRCPWCGGMVTDDNHSRSHD